jgi:hypothetical protein
VKMLSILPVALAFASIWIAMAAGLTAVWLIEEVRVLGLVTLATAIVVSLLVMYFDWRGRMIRRLRTEHDAHQEFDEAA